MSRFNYSPQINTTKVTFKEEERKNKSFYVNLCKFT